MNGNDKIYYFSLGLALLALAAVIQLHLLPALLGGLLIYNLVEFGARMLSRAAGVILFDGKVILLALLSIAVIAAFVLASREFVSYISSGPESFVSLMQRMADVVDRGRSYLPAW